MTMFHAEDYVYAQNLCNGPKWLEATVGEKIRINIRCMHIFKMLTV